MLISESSFCTYENVHEYIIGNVRYILTVHGVVESNGCFGVNIGLNDYRIFIDFGNFEKKAESQPF